MSRNPKFSKEIKIKACQDYLSANGSHTSIALNIGTDESTVRWWCWWDGPRETRMNEWKAA